MRELKFKGWDADKKEMLPPQDLTQGRVYWPWLGIKDVQLLQFSGLLDSKGQEIYEGDVIRLEQGDAREIVFENGAFYVKCNHGFDSDHLVSYYEPKDELGEIIGNIYENPDLIK